MRCCILSPSVTICLGDCREIIDTLPFDAVVTDPPYGINYVHKGIDSDGISINRKPIHGDKERFDISHLIALQGAHTTQGARTIYEVPLVIFGANHFCNQIPPYQGSWLCWDKSCGQGANSNFVDAEFIWMNRKTKRCIYRHFWLGMCRTGQGNSVLMKRSHPSMKPVELMAWLIETARIGVGKTILDPYMGSGSTGIAALQTGRKFIGVEIDEEYFEIAKERLQQEINRQTECFEFTQE